MTAKGTVLAWCEARNEQAATGMTSASCCAARPTTARPGARRKSIANVPGPKTKNPFALRMKNVDPADVTYNNPVLIADRDGTVHMLFCLEYMRCFYQRSDDDGVTWSKPVEITAGVRGFQKDYDWKVLATGPNHSIQLKSGRLVVPVWLSTGTGGNAHRPSVTATIYSDDQGKTWQAGEIAVPCTDEWINPNETVAVELARRQRDAQRAQRIQGASPPRHHQQGRRHRLEHAEVRRRPARTDLHGRHRALQPRERRQESHPVFQPAQSQARRRQGGAGQEPRPQERLRETQLRRRPDLAGEQDHRARRSAYSDIAVTPDRHHPLLLRPRHQTRFRRRRPHAGAFQPSNGLPMTILFPLEFCAHDEDYSVSFDVPFPECPHRTALGHVCWRVSRALGNSTVMTFGRATIRAGQSNLRHRHPNCDEACCMCSTAASKYGRREESFVLNAGDTISIPTGVWHQARALGDWEAVMAICFCVCGSARRKWRMQHDKTDPVPF